VERRSETSWKRHKRWETQSKLPKAQKPKISIPFLSASSEKGTINEALVRSGRGRQEKTANGFVANRDLKRMIEKHGYSLGGVSEGKEWFSKLNLLFHD